MPIACQRAFCRCPKATVILGAGMVQKAAIRPNVRRHQGTKVALVVFLQKKKSLVLFLKK
jgi:hypothetical protein